LARITDNRNISAMEALSHSAETEVEVDHWWFRGRRRLFGRILRHCGVAKDARILDAGSSSGSNLRLLRDQGYSNFVGLEISPHAIAMCQAKDLGPIERGDICAMPFADGSFDFVLATDIIEHVDRDDLALKEMLRVLKPGGYCLVTVPAFQSLWGHEDVKLHHKRRYRLRPLLERMRAAGLAPVESYYFNYLLFLPIWCVRRLARSQPPSQRNETQFAPFLNIVLSAIFALDTRTAPLLKPGFGVSVLVLARRPA
jgi:SAM-dependent methyltransferase